MTTPLTSGSVIVTTPTAPATKVTTPVSGSSVLTSPGRMGPAGPGIELEGAVPEYTDLPDDLGPSDAGASYIVQSNGKLYVWSGIAWPLEANGADFKGDTGDAGRGIDNITIDGDDLDFHMSDASIESVTVPAIAAANASAAAALASQTAAASSASSASASASSASTSATNAGNSASSASTSATNAGTSASAASGSASAAATSATNAATSETNADADRVAAQTAATTATTQASNAASAATTATTARDDAIAAKDDSEAASVVSQGYATNAADSAAAAAASAEEAGEIISSGIPNATSSVKGGILLPGGVGKLGGTYDDPTVGGWDTKADLVGGKVPVAQLPNIVLVSTQVVADTAARLALTAETGDIAIQTGNPGRGTYILKGSNPTVSGDWELMVSPTDAVTSVNGYNGIVVLAKGDVGLSNVDNTSDANKPISTATQTALNGKAATSHSHSGADITSGTVPYARLPVGTTASTVAAGDDSRMTNARTPTAHTHDAADINAGTIAIARIPTGTTGTTVPFGNDARFTDQRTPSDNSVTSAKIVDGTIVNGDINASAAIALSKLAAGYVQGSVNGTVTTLTVWTGTQAQYNALGSWSSTTVYVVTA